MTLIAWLILGLAILGTYLFVRHNPQIVSAVKSEHQLLIYAGIVIGFLLFGLVYLVGHMEAKAIDIAETMTTKLRASESRFRGLLEAAPDAIIVVDSSGKIIIVNSQTEKIFGYSRDEILGKSIDVLVPQRFRGSHPKHRERFASEPRVRPMGAGLELAGLHKNGHEFPVEISLSPMQTEEGMLVSSAIRDITQRKSAEQEIKDLNHTLESRNSELSTLNKELESFSYSVSHDLRAPLRAIDGFGAALVEDCADQLDAAGKSYIERIRAATVRMGMLIDDLLKLSRTARVEMAQESVNLSVLAEEVIAHLRKGHPNRNVSVSIAPNMFAEGDRGLLYVVLENLLGNAWKFTSKRDDAEINFGKEDIDGESVFVVRDNGAGFDMRFAEKLFGAFQRLHADSDFRGTGIGLATVQRVVHRHGGTVWADSKVGVGSTFRFKLGSNNSGVGTLKQPPHESNRVPA